MAESARFPVLVAGGLLFLAFVMLAVKRGDFLALFSVADETALSALWLVVSVLGAFLTGFFFLGGLMA